MSESKDPFEGRRLEWYHGDPGMLPLDDGPYVFHADALAEVQRLQSQLGMIFASIPSCYDETMIECCPEILDYVGGGVR